MTFDLISFGLGVLMGIAVSAVAVLILVIRASSDNVNPWDVE